MFQFHKSTLIFLLAYLGFFSRAAVAGQNLPNQNGIVPNRAPLVSTPFIALPLGSVHPLGWLLNECELQRDGLTGHAEEIYSDDLGTNSGWLGGTGESWERGPYYFKGLVSLAYTLDDDSLKRRAQKWLNWLINSQDKDGFIGPKSNRDWWPRMVATYALRDYYEATGDPRVPVVMSNYFHFMQRELPQHPLVDWGKARAGDEMDCALWLYNRNGDTNLLSLVQLLREQAYDWVGIFSSNNFTQYGKDFQPKHNVNVEQALKFPALYYQLSRKASDAAAFELGWKHLMDANSLSCGINSGTEFISGNASIQGVELCAIVEGMLSLETIGRITGGAEQFDRLEKIAFNALPAALANRVKAHQYYTLPNNVIAVCGQHGFNQDYESGTLPGPNSGYACCRYDFHMGWPKLVQNSWAATDDGGLAALTYAPSVVSAAIGGEKFQIQEDTRYPFEEQVRLKISLDKPLKFTLKLRIPSWCEGASITINGKSQEGVKAGEFYSVLREWKNGDSVVINLPMELKTSRGPERSVGIERGPLVYSLKIGADWKIRTVDPLKKGFDELEVRPATPWNYALQLDAQNPTANLAFTNFGSTENPFASTNPSVALIAKARQLPEWTMGWRGTHAFEPPTSPVASTKPWEDVLLVPFGTQNLRVSWFPILGTPAPTVGSFSESFDSTWSQRWTVFGGNWLERNGRLNTVPASANGAKALAMATAFSNFTCEADVSVGPVGDAGLIFRVSKPDIGADAYCGYYVGISAQNSEVVFGCTSNSWHPIKKIQEKFIANQPGHLKIEAIGTHLRIFVNHATEPLLEADDDRFAGGMVGVRHYCTDGDVSVSSFSNLKVLENNFSPQAR